MGIIERFGRIADTYMEERNQLLEADEERRRVFEGHGFWPTEVLRDTLIFASIIMVIAFYCWLIPPPLHSAADPFAQAGFVFPDWYVLFSYGYLRWGEYLPQFIIPAGPIGEFFGSPVISWNAAWWGAALTGIPVGILALPPFLPGREKRGVEDPRFATAGAIYLAHVWFISVFSINIFLELYAQDRLDYCWIDHHVINCGRQQPWTAEVFNAIPWILTGILIFAILFFSIRWFLVNSIGARLTPAIGRQLALGTIVAAIMISVVTWPVYENGFWDYGGLGAMDDVEELEKLRAQPADTLIEYDHGDRGNAWDRYGEHCIGYADSSHLSAWDDLPEGDPTSEWCVMPAEEFMAWGIWQPTQRHLVDFANVNGHIDPGNELNGAFHEHTYTGFQDGRDTGYERTENLFVEDIGDDEVITDVGCSFRTSVRNAGVHTQSLVLMDSSDNVVWSLSGDECETATLKLDSGESYSLSFMSTSADIDDTVEVIIGMTLNAYQPLMLAGDGSAIMRSEGNWGSGDLETMMVENPTFEKNPKSLDAKLIYSLFVPCLGFGALVYMALRSMARGYEWEMNKCYGCDLCDDACPVRLFNAGDKLNIIYNTWNNEDDGVPLYSCLTCTACTNACPQLVDYDSYVDIRRSMIVGGPPAAEIPHTVLQAVLAAEAEEDADESFIPVEDYPLDSTIGYYPGCVDYIDQEMVFSHVNEGSMNLGDTTTAAFTIFDEMDVGVSYLGRDFLKCCGHDQKWQGMSEVFEKLKAYNQKKLKASGIETLVTSCAECFRTFAMDYELDEMKVMHTTEFITQQGFDVQMAVEEDVTVTYHDPCRLGRQMNIYEEPRDLVRKVEGVSLVEMEHHGEDGLCCGVSSMMSCNENSRSLRLQRFDEVKATGAEIMLTSCPKCVSHFECLKFEGDPRHDFEILDVVSFLARQIESKRA